MNESPKELWEDGPATAVLEVRIHLDEHGRIWSVHQFKTATDEQKTFQWSGGGARQLSYAFLTETLRREAYTSILAELSKNPDFLKDYKTADEDKKTKMEEQLSYIIQAVLSNTALKMGTAPAKEVLQMLASQV